MIKIIKEKIVLKPEQFKPSSKKFKVVAVINPAAIRLPNGDILLYVRVIEKLIEENDKTHAYSPRYIGTSKFEITVDEFEKSTIQHESDLDILFIDGTKRLKFISHLRRVFLTKSGFEIKKIEQKPAFYGLVADSELGVEDPRIVKIHGLYVMTYVSLSRKGNVSTSYAISKDALNWKRKGMIFEEQNKDVVLFPEKINGEYFSLNRPEGNFQFSLPHIWVSSSPDLKHWKITKQLMLSKKSWDSGRVGAGPPPFKIESGWLVIYHGVIEHYHQQTIVSRVLKEIAPFLLPKDRTKYLAGVILLDINNPNKIIARAKKPLLYPNKVYESGMFEKKDVVFPTGIVLDIKKKDILLFSGGGDIVTTVKKISLKEILNCLTPIR